MPDHDQIRQIIQEEITRAMKPTNDKVDQMYAIFSNAKGFSDVAVTLLKALILIGAAIGVVYSAFRYLKT